jgi:biotin carboxyl carrier protein
MAAMWVEIGGRRLSVELVEDGSAMVDGASFQVDVRELGPERISLLRTGEDGRTYSYDCGADEGAVVIDGDRVEYAIFDPRSLRGRGLASSERGPRLLKAPMPGRIVRVLVTAGESVGAGQACVVIEAMKMQNELKAPKAGVVARLAAVVDETVAAGAVLLVVE